jgi:hypothetical protein
MLCQQCFTSEHIPVLVVAIVLLLICGAFPVTQFFAIRKLRQTEAEEVATRKPRQERDGVIDTDEEEGDAMGRHVAAAAAYEDAADRSSVPLSTEKAEEGHLAVLRSDSAFADDDEGDQGDQGLIGADGDTEKGSLTPKHRPGVGLLVVQFYADSASDDFWRTDMYAGVLLMVLVRPFLCAVRK